MKNNTKKTVEFSIIAFLVLLTRFYDVYTTWLYTPDLNKESNFLVKWFGAGWAVMITIQVLFPILIILALHYYMFRYQPSLPISRGLSFKKVSSYLFYNDTNSLHKLFYKLPQNKDAMIASLGYVGSMALIFISFIVGTSTTYLLISEDYRNLYKKGIPYILYTIIIILAIYFYYRFFNKYYKQYKRETLHGG